LANADDDGGSRAADVTPAAGPVEDPAVARARSLALLEATHQFPGAYSLTVIAFNREGTTTEVKRAIAGDRSGVEHRMIESGAGKYVSHRFSVQVAAATEVLEIYARVRLVEGVVTVL
jgi:putative lipoic acid-binding regulatory protein